MIPHHDTLRNRDGMGHEPSCSSGVRRKMCEDGPIAAVAVWQQVLAEQARRSVRRTQRGRGNEAHGTNSGTDRRAS